MEKGAIFSPDRKYRYVLWRHWGGMFSHGDVMFIGLNPSIADEKTDDPTIRRCISYAKAWGYSGMYMTNLFAHRSTYPVWLRAEEDPVGPENDWHLKNTSEIVEKVVAVWGIGGGYLHRHKQVIQMIEKLYHLGFTKEGYPKHPLYLKKDLKPILWDLG